jgi:hypothetical protein
LGSNKSKECGSQGRENGCKTHAGRVSPNSVVVEKGRATVSR